jgi:4-hydroxy-tetrahydrodipicolinate synthase
LPTLEPGVWGVLPTPFGSDGAVDHDSLSRAVDLYRTVGSVGVVGLGVFGEAGRLSADERAAVLRTVVQAAQPLGVVAGITYVDTREACTEATMLTEAVQQGVTALMVQANSADPAQLAKHLASVHESCGLSIVVQDYPVSSGVTVSPEALAEAISGLPFVAAVKCESPPTSPVIGALAGTVDVPLFGGLGGVGLLDELCAGAAGAMTGFSHPEALVATVNGWRDGGFPAARDALEPWLPLINFEGQVQIGLAIRKEHFRRRGVLSSAAVRPPARSLPPELMGHIDRHLSAVRGLVQER